MQQGTTPEDRLPPQDLEAEQATLGAMLIDPEAADRALSIVSQDDFYREAHQVICSAIRTVRESAQALDLVTVGAELRRREKLAEVGGAEYLTALIGEVPTTAHVIRYATIVRDKAVLRTLVRRSEEFQRKAYRQPDDVLALLAEARSEFEALHESVLAAGGPGYTTAQAAAEALGEITWAWEPWVPNGFLTVLAGETGIGKSKLALRLVESVVRPRDWPNGGRGPKDAAKALYIDTEGAQAMHVSRMKAAGLPMDRVLLPGDEGDAHLYLDDPSTLPFVRLTCERECVKLVVVDSLRSGMTGDENSSEFGEKLGAWSALARDLNIPFVIVHHARKALGDRQMSLDRLRGSSAIAALARAVIAIDQPDETTDRLRVRQIENNLGRLANPFGLEITENGCDPAPVPYAPRGDVKQAEAEEWLRDVLRRGPVNSGEVRGRAEEEGIARNTLYRAREAIGVRELPDPKNGRKRSWALPASPDDEAQGAL